MYSNILFLTKNTTFFLISMDITYIILQARIHSNPDEKYRPHIMGDAFNKDLKPKNNDKRNVRVLGRIGILPTIHDINWLLFL